LEAGCEKIYKETASGAKPDRPVLEKVLKRLKPGDELVVWRLDRLGRALGHLVALVEELGLKGVGFSSLHERIDTASANGKLQFHMFCALAEFERALISERTKAGLAAARAKGKRLGRPNALTARQVEKACAAVAGGATVAATASKLGVHPRTLHRALRKRAELDGSPPLYL